MYQHLAYRNALELYLHEVERHPENNKAHQRIADCYFRLGNIDKAEREYANLVGIEGADPIYSYQYAQILSIQGKYGDAEKWFLKYAKSQQGDVRAQHKLDFIYSLSYYYRDSLLYSIENESYNSDQSDFAAHYHKDNIVFVSARDRDLFIKKKSLSAINDEESHLNVYTVSSNSTAEEGVRPFYHDDLNSSLHDGPITFFDQQKQIAFTRSNIKNGKPHVGKNGRVNLKLYFARLNEDDKMSHLQEFPFNDNDYSVGHPWVSEDGSTLYFASDMPGGIGGVDLYKTTIENGKWLPPANLGTAINTMGDEFYPYVKNDSLLYFSSNGHGGLGGLDIFVATISDKEELPVNLGFPLNTSADDFSLVLDKSGRAGLFSSNREGGSGYDDIYRFTVNSFFLTAKVIDRGDSSATIEGATVHLWDENGEIRNSATSDANGIVHFDLNFDSEYKFSAAKQDYSWVDTLNISTYTRFMGGDSVLVPLWKQDLVAKGTVYSNETQSRLMGAAVEINNLTDHLKSTVEVDGQAGYAFDLEPNKEYEVTASKTGHLSSGFKLNTRNIFNGSLVNDILLEEIFVEKAIVQFEFDRYDLMEGVPSQLEPILRSLKRNKEATLHIGAHADSFGTHEYNQVLSDRRAQSVMKYFINQGIAKSRIVAIGFGEELLLNRCSNGTDCSDEEHSLNRRAEIKVQMPE